MKRAGFVFICWLFLVVGLSGRAAAAGVDYDIVYARCPRFGDAMPAKFQDVLNPARLNAGCDLMLLHPDGSEVLLVAGGLGSVADPQMSFDGQWAYYTYYPNLQQSEITATQLPKQGADLYKVNLATKQIVRLPHPELRSYEAPAGGALGGYTVMNIHPAPVAGGKIMFVSNRYGQVPTSPYLARTGFQLFIMDEDGENVQCIGPLSLGDAFHPVSLTDGRVLFSSAESQGTRDARIWSGWGIWPDGRVWEPLISGFDLGQSIHFCTQLSNSDLVCVDYYNSNNFGFGSILRWPLNGAPLGQSKFGSPDASKNAPIAEFYDGIGNYPRRMPFEPWGIMPVTPFNNPSDRDAPKDTGKCTHPAGGPNNDLLVACSPGPVHSGSTPAPDAGLYVIHGGGPAASWSDVVVIKNDPNYNELWPRAAVPYKAIYGVDTPKVLPFLPNDGSVRPDLPAGTPYAAVGTSTFYKRNSANGKGVDPFRPDLNGCAGWFCQGADVGSYTNADIAAVQIIAQEPSIDRGTNEETFVSHAHERLKILGEVPLRKVDGQNQPILDPEGNPDTSFLALIPADQPFTFAMLDSRGHALNVALTWHQGRPGEQRSDCGGCHAHAELPLLFEKTAAAKPDYKVADLRHATLRNWEFVRDIRPVLQATCISCHGGATPAAGLKLDDLAPVGNLYQVNKPMPGDWVRLAADWGVPSRFGPKPPTGDTYQLPQASRYIRMMQARRSLLIWELYNARLDGLTNASATDDIDFTPGTVNHLALLTEAQRKMIVEWITLGACFGEGCYADTQRPTVTISKPRPNDNVGPLDAIVVGFADADAGLDLARLTVTADVPINGTAPGQNLAANRTVVEGILTIPLTPPITTLAVGHVTATIADKAGNRHAQTVKFSEQGTTTPTPLPAPKNFKVKPGQTITDPMSGQQIYVPTTLMWDAVPGAARYELKSYLLPNGAGTQPEQLDATISLLIQPGHYLDKAARAGAYKWTVKACSTVTLLTCTNESPVTTLSVIR